MDSIGGETLEAAMMDRDGASDPPAVSVDDVIDAHVLLRDFEGDVHQLIARFDGGRP